uniref:STAS domain-containing protein n=1 Tax=Panagrellus redivivus TaxID=6233 RepID=A0A7E4ZQA1_PANRE
MPKSKAKDLPTMSAPPPPKQNPPKPADNAPAEKTAISKTETSLESFDTLSHSLTSARSPDWIPPKKATAVLNLSELMREDHTQTPEVVPTPRQTPQAGALPANATRVHLVSEGTRVYRENVLNQEQFDKKFGFRRVNLSLIRVFETRFHQITKWRFREWRGFVKNRMPILEWLPNYDFRHDLPTDIIGGLMLSIMSIPQGLAYGLLVGLPPIFGLYTSIVGPLIYAILGSSRHASPGGFAIIALMVGSLVEQATIPEDDKGDVAHEYLCCAEVQGTKPEVATVVEIVSCLTFMVGIFQIVFGILNAGLLSVWLSDHLVQGLTSGAAIHVLTSSLKSMTGVPNLPPTSEPNGIVKFYICFFAHIKDYKPAPTICSAICCFLLIYSKEILDKAFNKWMKVKFPMELFVVVFSILLTFTAEGTPYDFKLQYVGKIDSGMYTPFFPNLRRAPKVASTAFSIAVIGFVIHIAMAKLISKKLSYPIDPNQEWLALGVMNSVAACFGCFCAGSSLSRTMTQVKLGTKTQLSTVVCSCVLIGVVYGLSFCFYYLPKAVLSCIVVVALKDLFFQILDSYKLFHQSFIDFMIWLVTFMAVVLINVNYGLIIGVTFALLTVIFRSQWPESLFLGRIPGTCDFKGMTHYRSAEEVPGVFVFRFDAPLYFANAELFLNRLRDQMGVQPFMVTSELKKKTDKAKSERVKASKREMKKTSAALPPPTPETTPLNPEKKEEIEVVFKNSKVQRSNVPNQPEAAAPVIPDEPQDVHVTHIVIDCSSFPYIDLMGIDALGQAHKEFDAISITVYFACCKVAVRQMFEQTDFYKRVPKRHMFVSVWDAVNQAYKDRNALPAQPDEKTTNIEFPMSTDTGPSPSKQGNTFDSNTKEKTADADAKKTLPSDLAKPPPQSLTVQKGEVPKAPQTK